MQYQNREQKFIILNNDTILESAKLSMEYFTITSLKDTFWYQALSRTRVRSTHLYCSTFSAALEQSISHNTNLYYFNANKITTSTTAQWNIVMKEIW